MPGNAEHTIKYDDVGSGMKDGDTIRIDVGENECPTDKIKLGLSLGHNITWWKGLLLFTPEGNNDYMRIAELQDDQPPVVVEVEFDILRKRELVLSKAKAFGIHTNMYWIQDVATKMRGGNRYTFVWEKD